MNNLVAKRSQLVKAVITRAPAFGQQYKFDQVPNISFNNILVYGVSAYTTAELTVSPDQDPVVPVFTGITVTFVTQGKNQRIFNMPLVDLIRTNNAGFVPLFDYLRLTVTECFITIVDAAGLSVDEAVLFNFYYAQIEAK